MDPRLTEVAMNGDIDTLYTLIGEDPFVLENVEKIPFINTPLHCAVLAGYTCFVEEITNLKPSFTLKLNQDGFTPLHLASIFGHLDIVKMLLKDENGQHLEKKVKEAMNFDGGGGLCMLKGREKRIPLHCAAIAGHIDILKVLLSSCPESIKALTIRKETALHLAVKFGQVEAMKLLVSWLRNHWHHNILSQKDQGGNTILHLAISRGQYEIVKVVLHNSFRVRVNARNAQGLTALDLLLMHYDDLPGSNPEMERIKTMLSDVGAKKGEDIGFQRPSRTAAVLKWVYNSRLISVFTYIKLKVEKDIPSDARNALLVIVVLIATATYQTGVNPPGGYWQNASDDINRFHYYAGEPIWSTTAPLTYNLVMLFNFAGFTLSLILAYNLTIGFPLRVPLLLALGFMLLTYSWSTPIFYNGPSGFSDYFLLNNGNIMLWVPVFLVLVIWAITANWMGRIWWKLSMLTGLSRN